MPLMCEQVDKQEKYISDVVCECILVQELMTNIYIYILSIMYFMSIVHAFVTIDISYMQKRTLGLHNL